jgi:hypothetical protein
MKALVVRASRAAAMTALAAALLGACGNVESDIRRAFVERYERENCLSVASSYPFQVREGPGFFTQDIRWLDALVQGGMLQVVGEPVARQRYGGAVTTLQFDLTEAGRQRLKDNKLCYGHTTVERVIDYQGPRTTPEGDIIVAEVLLKHHTDGDWVRHPALRHKVKAGEEKLSRTLVKKAKAGWSLP